MAKVLKDTDGFIFHGWMRNRLGLTGGELFAFALVHQFSQSNAGTYVGGPGYLAAWIGCSVNTARNYLHSLMDKGLIKNHDREVNGVTFRDYVVDYDAIQNSGTPSKNWSTPLQNLEAENNNENNTSNEVNISITPNPKKFDFRKALLSAGVEPQVADAWMQVRKAKKAVNTEIAWMAIEKEIAKTGSTANDCIRCAVEHSWSGFKAEWCEPASARDSYGASRHNKPRSGEAGYMDRARAAAIELGIDPFNSYE